MIATFVSAWESLSFDGQVGTCALKLTSVGRLPQYPVTQGLHMNRFSRAIALLLLPSACAFANVTVRAPQSGQTVAPLTNFVATANTTTCSYGVAAMGVYVDNQLEYVTNGHSLNTSLNLTVGHHNTVVQSWDFCGGVSKASVPVTVQTNDAVWVTSPVSGSTTSPQTNFVATATSSCPGGVSAMGIYENNQLVYQVHGASLNTQLALPAGTQTAVVQAWDYCGGSSSSPVSLTVLGPHNTFTDIQNTTGWFSWGQLAPDYSDCDYPCNGVQWSMVHGIQSPSLDGKAAQVNLGGSTPYSDVLFANHLIGPFSTQNLPDPRQTLLPTLHNFSYDAYFYVADAAHTQALEFDTNWFMNSVGMTWGTECRLAGGNEWDIWDNVEAKWVPTGVPCNALQGQWNHVTINVQRTPDNMLLYQSITLNGVTATINKTYPPFTVPSDWYGITVNYQMDGDVHQTSTTSYIDRLNFTYW